MVRWGTPGHTHLPLHSARGGDVAPIRHDEAEHRSAANRALLYSAMGLGASGGIEFIVALFTHSVGLLVDSLHNLSDVSTSLVVFLGFWVSKRPASRGHPYGYDRAEDIAGIGVALAIWSSAVFAGTESIWKLVHHGETVHLGWGIAAAVVGIAGNQAVARYKGRVGKRIQSATLLADARHSWLDAISSLGAAAGLLAVALGFPLGDPIAGLAITLMICHVGYEVTTEIVTHLMDAVDPALLDEAENGALSVPGVKSIRARGRWAGRSLRIDVRAELDASITLGATVPIVSAIEAAVFDAVGEARVVEVQVGPRVVSSDSDSPSAPR
jgi:cation diffusion facilitator family transporter